MVNGIIPEYKFIREGDWVTDKKIVLDASVCVERCMTS
jgi:hypothetical protein